MTTAFQIVLGRAPDETEQSLIVRMLSTQRQIYVADPKAASALLAVGTVPRDTNIPEAEHAALTATCLGLLNLDAAQTRE